MISTFEVASVFKIKDEATATLTRMAEKVAEFNLMVKEARENLAGLSRLRLSGLNARLQGLTDQAGKLRASFGNTFATMDAQVGTAITEVHTLAAEWQRVAAAATAASRATRAIAAANPRQRVMGHGGGGGGGIHVSSLGLPFPGGHANVRIGNNAAMAGAGMLAYGAYQEAQFEDAAFRAMYTAGIPADKGEQARRFKELRDLVQREAAKTGMPVHDVEGALLVGMRQFAGMPWGQRIAVMPPLMEAAAAEARLKDSSTAEGMEVFTGFAHMMKHYSVEDLKRDAPKIAYLSTVDPERLKSMERTASYAVPILQSGLEFDPFDTLLLMTAMQRGGVANTKSGTWIRELAIRAQPGTSLMSKTAFKKHEEALHALGLVDANNQPTWFTAGKPDLLKLLDIGGEHAGAIPLTQRAAIERQLFGAQGSGAFALLSDPAIRGQIEGLKAELARFETGTAFFKEYGESSPIQQFRETWADLQNVLMDIGTKVLPPLTDTLRSFDSGLKTMKDTLGSGVLGTIVTAGLGAYAGGRIAGAPGAIVGGILGAALPNKQEYGTLSWSDWWTNIKEHPGSALFGLRNSSLSSSSSSGSQSWNVVAPPTGQQTIQVTSNLYVDGDKLAMAVTKHQVRQGAGPAEGAPYHDPTFSTAPLDYAIPF